MSDNIEYPSELPDRPVIRRRRGTKRRAWGPTARFFLRHLFRWANG